VQAAREAGIAGVHLRTDLLCDEATCQALLAAPLDAISIDLGAHRPETYARLRGINGLDAARAGALRLAQAARAGAGGPWIVPRLVKCDDVIGEFEDFYDFWLSRTGACVLDALPRAVNGLDVRPLPLPRAGAGATGGRRPHRAQRRLRSARHGATCGQRLQRRAHPGVEAHPA
jgi:hypothetical protein